MPALLGAQRQFPQERAGHADPVRPRRGGRRLGRERRRADHGLGIVFIAPFFILSALGGELADRYDKAHVAAAIRLAEIPIAGLAAAGFFLHSVAILFVTLGLFGIVAALFGPVKYGMLPEKLETAELPAGNALVEGATFLAILVGTIAGGIAVENAETPEPVVAVILALAVASWGFARANPGRRPRGTRPGHHRQPVDLHRGAAARIEERAARLWSGTHIVSWFWLVGSVTLSLLPALVKNNIGGNEDVVTLGLTTFSSASPSARAWPRVRARARPTWRWCRWAPP